MLVTNSYLFQSARLGFRNWLDMDIETMCRINADPDVMAFFPGTHSEKETIEFLNRMQKQYAEKGFCYFAVDTLENNQCIGFIGLSEQTFEADFTPCIDIGWRLAKQHWGKGLATEGAARCLDYAFNNLKFQKINAIAPKVNIKSIRIMEKIGMKKIGDFLHPKLKTSKWLQECVLYELINNKLIPRSA